MANANVPFVTLPYFPGCRICHRPVDLRSSNTDEDGQAVHEQCYVEKLCALKLQTNQKKPPRTEWFLR
ncbi:MAG: hypothetical protein ABSF97_19435 [Candidatus Sulfotelmatobacter sp.]